MWKSRILFAAALLLSVVFVLLYENTDVSFLLLYGLLLLMLFSLGTVLAVPWLIRIRENADRDTVFKDEQLLYHADIVNKGLFYYPRMQCAYRSHTLVRYGEGDIVTQLLPRGSVSKEYTVSFPYRGVYELGIRSLTVTDFLGLFRRRVLIRSPLSVAVCPKSEEDFTLPIQTDPGKAAARLHMHMEDYTEVADVRKYTPSDNSRNIHWKLTAKRGEFMVKNFQTDVPDKTILFLDTQKLALTGARKAAFEDRMASVAVSGIVYCARQQLPVDFFYGETHRDQITIEPSEELNHVFRLLAELPFAGEVSSFPICADSVSHGLDAVNMAAFLSGMDDAVFNRLKNFVSFEHKVYLYYFYSRELPLTAQAGTWLDSLEAYGADVTKIEVE